MRPRSRGHDGANDRDRSGPGATVPRARSGGPRDRGEGPPEPPALIAGDHRNPPRLDALGTVRDPELDEPITSLGFVASCTVSADGDATVRLRLPTYFCAPNFAFLMVADAYDAVAALPGVRRTEIVLEDHFASDAINGGVAAHAGFAQSFDGEAVGELHDLRADFLRKAVMAGTDLVCRPLIAAGTDPSRLPGMVLGDLPASRELDRLRAAPGRAGPARRRRRAAADRPQDRARRSAATRCRCTCARRRTTRISIESNGSICRGMLQYRYDTQGQGEEDQ